MILLFSFRHAIKTFVLGEWISGTKVKIEHKLRSTREQSGKNLRNGKCEAT